LAKNGFVEVRCRGSHVVMQLRNGNTTRTIPVPDHDFTPTLETGWASGAQPRLHPKDSAAIPPDRALDKSGSRSRQHSGDFGGSHRCGL